jgi:hypothetical protein|tara:strand:- start:389 stop:568 length:180 start_codon:yes stop_codon:yes gene_type:complete
MLRNLFFNKAIKKVRKKEIKDLKKYSYRKNWQKVDPDFYLIIFNYKLLSHQKFQEYIKT